MHARPPWRAFPNMVGLLFLIFLSFPLTAQEDAVPPFFGKVTAITPSNSLIVQRDGGDLTQVVLAFLSIPFAEQPYADRAHEVLRAQLLNRRVSVRTIGDPDPQYTMGLVYVGNQNFNLDFLGRGHAWVDYFQISHPAWLAAQKRARANKLGLYADPSSKHPIEWAREMKKAKVVVGLTDTMSGDPNFAEALKTTFVGHRKEKIFVPMPCFERWARWPRSVLVPFTSVAGAEDNGYRLENCVDPTKATSGQ